MCPNGLQAPVVAAPASSLDCSLETEHFFLRLLCGIQRYVFAQAGFFATCKWSTSVPLNCPAIGQVSDLCDCCDESTLSYP